MSDSIKVLLIDDDENNHHNLKNDAADFNIQLLYSKNTRHAIEVLKENKNIVGIIIDGVGFIEKNQEKGSEKSDFVHVTIEEINKLQNSTGVFYAKCVYTAYYEQLFDSLSSRVTVFDKREDVLLERKKMFEFLIEESKNAEFHRIRENYLDVFGYINDDLISKNSELKKFLKITNPSDKLEQLFFTLFIKLDKNEYDKYCFNICRDILEFYLVGLKNISIPENLYNSEGRPNQKQCIDYICRRTVKDMKGNILYPHEKFEGYFETPIQYCFDYLKDVTNEKSHIEKYKWTKHLIISVTNLLIEVLIWLVNKKRIEKKNP